MSPSWRSLGAGAPPCVASLGSRSRAPATVRAPYPVGAQEVPADARAVARRRAPLGLGPANVRPRWRREPRPRIGPDPQTPRACAQHSLSTTYGLWRRCPRRRPHRPLTSTCEGDWQGPIPVGTSQCLEGACVQSPTARCASSARTRGQKDPAPDPLDMGRPDSPGRAAGPLGTAPARPVGGRYKRPCGGALPHALKPSPLRVWTGCPPRANGIRPVHDLQGKVPRGVPPARVALRLPCGSAFHGVTPSCGVSSWWHACKHALCGSGSAAAAAACAPRHQPVSAFIRLWRRGTPPATRLSMRRLVHARGSAS